MTQQNREQKLIDIIFSVAQASYLMRRTLEEQSDYYKSIRDEHMEWVAKQLELCGFPTVQMGSSWGVLR